MGAGDMTKIGLLDWLRDAVIFIGKEQATGIAESVETLLMIGDKTMMKFNELGTDIDDHMSGKRPIPVNRFTKLWHVWQRLGAAMQGFPRPMQITAPPYLPEAATPVYEVELESGLRRRYEAIARNTNEDVKNVILYRVYVGWKVMHECKIIEAIHENMADPQDADARSADFLRYCKKEILDTYMG